MLKKVILWFDVEDYVTPEAEDSFYELLKLMNRHGVRATLKFCEKKYQQLINHGRTDILKLIADHELAFHMTDHSVHPIPSEYLDRMGFKEGALDFDRREGPGYLALREKSGQPLSSYGHPGVAWAPQVFPALRKWGIPTYLDVHDILRIDGQPFWYGGVLCLTKLNNLAHLDKEAAACSIIESVKNMNEEHCTDVVFLSMYDHPHELVCTEFWDSTNFRYGKNPSYLVSAPLRREGEFGRLLDQYAKFFDYMNQHREVEFVTAMETLRFEHQRMEPISAESVKKAAAQLKGEANYAQLNGGWCTASEVLNLMARHITGRALQPEMIYGPEKAEKSVVSSPVCVKELAEKVFNETERIFGYKQLPNLYRIGDNFINPVDAFAMLAKAITEDLETVEFVEGRLAAADRVDPTVPFGGSWDVYKEDFKAANIIEQTILQTWTLKPATF